MQCSALGHYSYSRRVYCSTRLIYCTSARLFLALIMFTFHLIINNLSSVIKLYYVRVFLHFPHGVLKPLSPKYICFTQW